uniref:Small integral membrane protein 3 n=1 Tax=Erpetoichthys calabaricus TaxID=27687 RepID=A0A8C4TIJ8_ERPCA
MEAREASAAPIPAHVLNIWAILLVILATIVVMTSVILCPAIIVILYRIRTNPIRPVHI